MEKQYTNELTPEILAGFDESPFTDQQLAEMSDDARAVVEEQRLFHRQHPITGIYRIAVAGSLTRRGGVADEFNPDPEKGYKILRFDGVWASVLTEGCTVTYPDGSQARIVTSAGKQYTTGDSCVALVGSLLDNGDEIISTPQSSGMLVRREGVPLNEDFLAAHGG